MTRTTCSTNNNTYVGIALEAECNDRYDHNRLRNRTTMAHQRFTRRNSRFLHIDDLYRSDSTITKLFLKINDIALNQTLNNIRRTSLPTDITKSTTMTRNKILRSQTTMYAKLKSPTSPTSSEPSLQLRPKRHTSFVNNFIDSSGDDDSNHIKPMRELRSATRILLADIKATEKVSEQTKLWDSGRPKRQIKPKRLSIDERTVVNNKNGIKVEVRKSKLKTANNKSKISIEKEYLSDSEDDYKGFLAMNRKRLKRESELTRLNNEAENFLFPRIKDDSSAESESTINNDTKPTPVSHNNELVNGNTNSISKCNRSFKCNFEEESHDSTSSDTSFRRRKRRLTQAEAFILDNQEYYKFETPGSRLRYHGSYLTPLPELSLTTSTTTTTVTTTTSVNAFFSKNNGDLVSKPLKADEPTKKVKKKYEWEKIQFSFESVPKCETWYEAFHRQDNGEERYTSCYNFLTEEKKILLPYELGAIPPLNPRICYYTYQDLRKSFLGESPNMLPAVCTSPDSCSLDTTSKTDETSICDDTTSSADFSNLDTPLKLRGRKKGGTNRIRTSSRTPRKSPRQHASTLAILGNLKQPRRRKLKPILPKIEEEKESKPDYDEITNFFNSYLVDLGSIDKDPEAIDCNVHCKPSAVRALEEYLDEPSKRIRDLADRKTVRKKKINKTGWPNKSKRLAFKKEGSHSSGSIIDSTDNNSRKENKLNCVATEVDTKPITDDNSAGDRLNCVNVDLAKWENAERLLNAKFRTELQPVVRVQKLASNITDKRKEIEPCTRPKRSTLVSPVSPRRLRRQRQM